MQIIGTAHMNAPIPVAWDAFHDPGVLTRTIPGLQSLEETGQDAYKATVSAGVAAIKGTYTGNVAITEQVKHESFLLKASGQGGPGTISADVRVRLSEAEDGGTDIAWAADASVGGPIGGVGQRMLQGVARKMATQFFAAIDADIASGGQGTPGPAEVSGDGAQGADSSAGSAQAPAAAGATSSPRTFAAPAPTSAGTPSLIGLLAAAALGAVVALLGVLVGQRGRN